MKRKTTHRRRHLGWLGLLAGISLLVFLCTRFYPYAYALLTNQPYINPKVKTRDDETYRLELWVKLPAITDTALAQEMLETSLANFSDQRPNFEINTTYLSESKAMEKLQIALEQGTPPDLFFHADSSQNFFGELQIQMAAYLQPTERNNWPDPVWQQATVNKQPHALPVALLPRVLMVNTDLWQANGLNLSEIRDAGWDWERFLQTITAAKSDTTYGFIPSSIGDELFAYMLAAWGQPAALAADGTPLWNHEWLLSLAEAWTQLGQSEATPHPSAAMDRDCLQLFLKGEAASIGPLNHHLSRWLWDKAVDNGILPALLPLPSQTGNNDLRGVYLSVFRQADYQGNRHTKAAAELAIFLTSELAEQMQVLVGAVPAQPHLLRPERFPYTNDSLQTYANLNRVLAIAYTYGPQPGESIKHWQHTLAPAWNALVQEEYTPIEFAEAVLTDLARATMFGP